jgi:DNA polymerase-4
MAREIRRRVRAETGLAVSVGVARTKHLAKVASQVAKPDGLVVVEPEDERSFLDPLPVELMWGVGPVTRSHLASRGIRTIGQLAETGSPVLEHLLGRAAGAKLSSLAANTDPRLVQPARSASSVGAQSAFRRAPPTPQLVRTTLAYLADRVAGRLRLAERAGTTVTVRVRFASLRSVTRSVTLPTSISATLTLTEIACELAAGALSAPDAEPEISLLSVSVSHLARESVLQLELPLGLPDARRRPGSPAGAARWGVDRSVDAIRARFGRESVGYASVLLSDSARVPDGFRELAERDPA